MNVLVACEYSGTVRDAFQRLGHNAFSCDLLPCDADPATHYTGDALKIMKGTMWDLIIAHPPCTYLSNSGVSWLHKDTSRWPKLFDAAAFFMEFVNSDCPKVCIENPIMHKYGRQLLGGLRPTQIVQPWMFGHKETKATGLYLKGLDPLVPTDNVKEETMALSHAERNKMHYLSPGPDRWKLRSKTYQGIADAMAEQWGGDA